MATKVELPPSPTDLLSSALHALTSDVDSEAGSKPPSDPIARSDSTLSDSTSTSTEDEKAESRPGLTSSDKPKAPSSIYTYQRGVWTVNEHVPAWTDNVPGFSVLRDFSGFSASIPYVRLLFLDLWKLGPFVCVVYISTQIFSSVVPTLRLARSSAFLHMIEEAVSTRQVNRRALSLAIFLQFLLAVLEWANYQASSWCSPILQQRFKYLVNERVMAVQLRLDMPTSEHPEVKAKLAAAGHAYGGGKAWEAFEKLVDFTGLFLELASTSSFVLGTMLHQPGGRTITMLCLVSPIINSFQERGWTKVFYAKISNMAYLRMEALYDFTNDEGMKQEMLGNGMGEYVIKEYTDARKQLADTSDEYPYGTRLKPWSLFSLAQDLASDSALVLLGIKMVLNPEAIPLMSIAVLEQTSMALNNTMSRFFQRGSSIMEAFNGVKALYEITTIVNEVKDGESTYPAPGSDEKGMEVEFKNVSFKYPRTDATVIDSLSFKIRAGSLCVIVGENGCGKSSTLKLLNRMYDVDSGEILVDSKPIKDYKIADLRSASAFMHQGYQHFDFSLAENIGFGNASRVHDMEAIKEAANLGGAAEFIEKLPESYDTKMEGSGWDHSWSYGDIPDGSALDLMIKNKKEPPKAFSGGQTQRLALSRTFMRSTTSDIKLLAYDEPSAALDPKAEFELFERLRNLRDGRTMLFITHRFGYLTKYADLIIYMEKGKAVEQGSHEELLKLNGQYAHLYNVQAQAFS